MTARILVVGVWILVTTTIGGAHGSFLAPLSTGRVPTTCRRRDPFIITTSSSRRLAAAAAAVTKDSPVPAVPDDNDDLTTEELALRFVDTLAYFEQSQEMSPDNVKLAMLRTRLPDLHLNRVYVSNSTIPQAGLGLFASRNITKGELVTLFPGDALLVWNNKVGDIRGGLGVMFGNHIDASERNATHASSNEARLYELQIRSNHSMVADARLINDAAYLAHMINDGAALTSKSNKARTKYSSSTFERHNAAFIDMEGCHYTAVATDNIQQHEEIFVSYGDQYWYSRL